jgi:hypothetical protein
MNGDRFTVALAALARGFAFRDGFSGAAAFPAGSGAERGASAGARRATR